MDKHDVMKANIPPPPTAAEAIPSAILNSNTQQPYHSLTNACTGCSAHTPTYLHPLQNMKTDWNLFEPARQGQPTAQCAHIFIKFNSQAQVQRGMCTIIQYAYDQHKYIHQLNIASATALEAAATTIEKCLKAVDHVVKLYGNRNIIYNKCSERVCARAIASIA